DQLLDVVSLDRSRGDHKLAAPRTVRLTVADLVLNLRFSWTGPTAADMAAYAARLLAPGRLAPMLPAARAHPVAALPLLQLALQLLHLLVQLGVSVLLLLESFAQLGI